MEILLQLLWNLFRSRKNLILEYTLLRQQLIICQRSVKRPKITQQDRIILVWLSKVYNRWKEAMMVNPSLVVCITFIPASPKKRERSTVATPMVCADGEKAQKFRL